MSKLYKLLAHFKSRTDKGTRHRVTLNTKTGYLSCSCRGFMYNKKCWHYERVLERLVDRGYSL